jgi:hypothetical protein
MLRERGIGEVNDVDIEVDDIAIRSCRKEFERVTRGFFGMASDVFQPHSS